MADFVLYGQKPIEYLRIDGSVGEKMSGTGINEREWSRKPLSTQEEVSTKSLPLIVMAYRESTTSKR